MTVLVGHPTGNPNSHNAALSYFELKQLEAFCVPWMPSAVAIKILSAMPFTAGISAKAARRHFAELAGAPLVQSQYAAFKTFISRMGEGGDVTAAAMGNEWLMRTMSRLCNRPRVTAIHSYEDCSLIPFTKAKRYDKACIYDMPIAYSADWIPVSHHLSEVYSDWAPTKTTSEPVFAPPEQKRAEMLLADLVLVPSTFAERSVLNSFPAKRTAVASYGVDADFWSPGASRNRRDGPLRFIFAGQVCLRKGIPLLLDAWQKANLPDATLRIVGHWNVSEQKKALMSGNVSWTPPCGPDDLRREFRTSDIFILPSYFEGFGLVILEAMACGLPAIVSDATVGADLVNETFGRVLPTGDVDALVESLRWFSNHRETIPEMSAVARNTAIHQSWVRYRQAVVDATACVV